MNRRSRWIVFISIILACAVVIIIAPVSMFIRVMMIIAALILNRILSRVLFPRVNLSRRMMLPKIEEVRALQQENASFGGQPPIRTSPLHGTGIPNEGDETQKTCD